MTIANFKTMVAAYLNRSAASLIVGSVDLLLEAMNDARRGAQRAHAFELLRTENAFLGTSQAGANWQTGCKTTPGGGTSLLMRRIDEVWNYSVSTAPSTCYLRTTRVPFDYSGQMRRELPVADSNQIAYPQDYFLSNRFAYAIGPTLFITTVSSVVNYKLVGIQWLDDLTGAETPDIFLTYYTDWFKYATLAALNIYLKDSERFPIDASTMENLWQSVKAHDGMIANMGESVDLE